MTVAYVDSSCVVAVALAERGGTAMARRLGAFDELVSSNLLESEVRAALARERVATDIALLSAISWILPDRPLHGEIGMVLDAGYLRGADCWHLAAALYLAGDSREVAFLTLDERQAKVAGALGFRR